MLSTTQRIDPRITRTRKLLVDAFMELLAEKRFEDISVQDITARATVNRATFYAHYADKYTLVDDMIGCGFARILHHRLQMQCDTAQTFVRSLFLAVTDHWTAVHGHCQFCHPMFDSLAEAQVKQQLRDHARGWLSEHSEAHGHSDERLDLAATIVSWSVYGAGMEWSKHTNMRSPEEFADLALPLIVASITALEETKNEGRMTKA